MELWCFLNDNADEMRREDLLEKLVTKLHLSVPERAALGLAAVPVNEVAVIVKRLLEANGVFPISAKAWQPGQPVFEGFFLVKKPHGGVRLTAQRSDPINPTVLADQKSWEYDNVDNAISQFHDSFALSRATELTASFCRGGFEC